MLQYSLTASAEVMRCRQKGATFAACGIQHAVNNELIMQHIRKLLSPTLPAMLLDTTKDEGACVCVSLCAYQSCHFFLLLNVLQRDCVRQCVWVNVPVCVCVGVHVQRLVSLHTTTVQAIESKSGLNTAIR